MTNPSEIRSFWQWTYWLARIIREDRLSAEECPHCERAFRDRARGER